MPLVPQFRAEAPPGPQQPTLQREKRNRVDPSQALQGLGAMAGILRRGAPQMDLIDPNLGQATGQGIQAVGKGLDDIGDAQFKIEERVAEIRNRYALHEAEVAMDGLRGEFEKWRLLNSNNPEKWEAKWREMVETGRDSYLKGKELAPQAQDAITMQWGSYGSRVQVQVGVDSVRRSVEMGGEALNASMLRKIEGNDIEGAIADADEGVRLGIWGPDKAEMMKIRMTDDFQAKQLEDGKNMIDFHLLNGNTESAMEVIDSLPAPDAEKQLMRAKVEKIHGVKIEQDAILDRFYDGEDPRKIKAELEERDENGNYKNHPLLSATARAEIIDPINKVLMDERAAKIEETTRGIEAKTIDNERELVRSLEGIDVDPTTFALLQKKLRGERIDTEEEVVSIQLKAANYDPKTDPDGVIYQSIQEQAGIVFGSEARPPLQGPDPRRDSIIDMLERRRAGQPLTAGQETQAQILREVKDLTDAAGSWKVPADRVRMIEENGQKIFIDTGADVNPGNPDYYENDMGWIRPAVKGRRMKLSQDDQIAVEQGKATVVEDVDARNRALAKAAPVADEIKTKLDNGEIKDRSAAMEKYQELIAPMRKDAAGKIIDGIPGGERSNFPPAQIQDAQTRLKGVELRPETQQLLMEAGFTM